METNGLKYWDKVKKPPPSALKPIKAGRLSGKTDISPQWRMQIITEIFGPCGQGWKYTIDKLWLEHGNGDQVAAFALVSLYYKTDDRGQWSEAIPGIGGSMLVAQETSGLRTSDEAFKMAVTDALSVAMKALGVAADIYLGNWDGSKYIDEQGQPKGQPQKPSSQTPRPQAQPQSTASQASASGVSDLHKKTLREKMDKAKLTIDEQKSLYAYINPQTATDAAAFIKNFDANLAEWRKQQPEPGANG